MYPSNVNAPRGSPTVPRDGQSAADVLAARRAVWQHRPLTREVYRRYFEQIARELSPGPCTLEIGGGSGMASEFLPNIITSDIVTTPFVHFVADALQLPLRDGGADNLVLVDVLHHLPRPARFFDEAARVLRPGGRLVMLEPYISPFSKLVFRLAHPEPVDMAADPLPTDDRPVFRDSGPFASNQAIPTLLFGRHADRVAVRFPTLRLVTRRLDSTIVYPLSGGFSGPCLLPRFLLWLGWALESATRPLRPLMAFRLLLTMERM